MLSDKFCSRPPLQPPHTSFSGWLKILEEAEKEANRRRWPIGAQGKCWNHVTPLSQSQSPPWPPAQPQMFRCSISPWLPGGTVSFFSFFFAAAVGMIIVSIQPQMFLVISHHMSPKVIIFALLVSHQQGGSDGNTCYSLWLLCEKPGSFGNKLTTLVVIPDVFP